MNDNEQLMDIVDQINFRSTRDLLEVVKFHLSMGQPVPIDLIFELVQHGVDYSQIEATFLQR